MLRSLLLVCLIWAPLLCIADGVHIPTLQVCANFNYRITTLDAPLIIQTSSNPASASGGYAADTFELEMNVTCRPGEMPKGNVVVRAFSDREVATRIDNAVSRDHDILATTALLNRGTFFGGLGWVSARCKIRGSRNCYLWVLIGDNDPATPSAPRRGDVADIVVVTILDERGSSLFYGSGIVRRGHAVVKVD